MGRLHGNKAFDVLITALARLPGVHAALAGDGPERAALAAQACGLGVAERVHFLGWRREQAGLRAACAMLCCPSRQVPLGTVVREGCSAGFPGVAAAAAGPSELIRAGETGLLVPPEDPDALAAALGSVLADRALADRLGAAGRAEYEAVHAVGPVLGRWRALLPALEPA